MIKEAVIGLFSAIDPVTADRWYCRYHAPDVLNVSGPWLRHYVTFRTYDPPKEAVELFGAKKGRYTELWFSNMEEFNTRPGMASFTDPPWGLENERRDTEQALLMIPVVPTEDFLNGREPKANSPIIRWICAIRYPKGVSKKEGEDWYLNVHTPEVNKQEGLLRHISFKALEGGAPPPGGPPLGDMPGGLKMGEPWDRLTEMWYRDMDAWKKAVIDNPVKYTAPSWSDKYPYVDYLSNFVYYKPDMDFLKGNYAIP